VRDNEKAHNKEPQKEPRPIAGEFLPKNAKHPHPITPVIDPWITALIESRTNETRAAHF
jgi:hypothetical protein